MCCNRIVASFPGPHPAFRRVSILCQTCQTCTAQSTKKREVLVCFLTVLLTWTSQQIRCLRIDHMTILASFSFVDWSGYWRCELSRVLPKKNRLMHALVCIIRIIYTLQGPTAVLGNTKHFIYTFLYITMLVSTFRHYTHGLRQITPSACALPCPWPLLQCPHAQNQKTSV